MERVLAVLAETGLLDEDSAHWVSAAHAERGGPSSTVLLELDVVEEDALLRALSTVHGTPAAQIEQLGELDRELASRLPLDVAIAFGLCPIRFEDYGVLAWVEAPLSDERRRELRETVGLETHPRLASPHHVAAARAAMYGASLDDRDAALQARLERRRAAVGLPATLSAVTAAPTLADAVDAATAFLADRLELGVFFAAADDALRVVGGSAPRGSWLPMPEQGCTFGAALRYRGYFLGPVAGSDPDRRFFASLSRGLARCAFVAPVPTPEGPPVVFFGENGERAISARLAAEISLVTARLAQRAQSWATLAPEPIDPRAVAAPAGEVPPALVRDPAVRPLDEPAAIAPDVPIAAPPDDAPSMERAPERAERVEADPNASGPRPHAQLVVTREERAVLDRLNAAARTAGVDLATYVDRLSSPAAPAAPAPRAVDVSSAALAGEVKDLFERLATDIPAQLARGMEAAFRDLAPRISGGSPPAAPPPAPRASAAAAVELVVSEAKPREVPSYGSRRAKTKRVKL